MAPRKIAGSGWIPDLEITDADVDQLQQLGRVTLQAEQKFAVIAAIQEYHLNITLWQSASSPVAVRNILAELDEKARDLGVVLARAFRMASPAEEAALDALKDNAPDGLTLDQAQRTISWLREAARRSVAVQKSAVGNQAILIAQHSYAACTPFSKAREGVAE